MRPQQESDRRAHGTPADGFRPAASAVHPVRAAIDDDVRAGRLPAALARIDASEAEGALAGGEAALLRAEVLRAWGREIEAARAATRAALGGEGDAATVRMRAWAAGRRGRHDEAVADWTRVRALEPRATGDRLSLARALLAAGRASEARAIARESLGAGDHDPDTIVLLAQLEFAAGHADRAEQALRAGLARAPDHPGLLLELATLEYNRYRDDEAIAILARASAVARDTRERAELEVRIAIGRRRQGRAGEGLHLLLETLPAEPVLNGHLELGPALLAAGDFIEGWRQFEHRWMAMPLAAMRGDYGVPTWTGQPLAGRTLLVRCEQGFGDVFQFVRYLPLLKARGARVLLLPLRGVESIAARFAGVDEVLKEWAPLPPLDFVVDLMSLPVGFATTVETIPASTPYIDADPSRRERWHARLGAPGGPRVGLVWAGRPEHPNDRRRSLRLDELRPLLEVEGVRFVSLQKGPAGVQAEQVPERIDWEQVGPELDDFADTAAVLANLDLLISVDTGVAHLAGALGRETWTLLPFPAEYRWLGDGADTPWYPTMRLFRQAATGGWPDVIAAVATALRAWVATRAPSARNAAAPAVVAPTAARPTSSIVPVAHGLARAARMRAGFLQYFPDDAPVGASLERYGEWVESLLAHLLRLVPSGAVLLEAGSGVGAHTLRFAQAAGPEGHVLAWEREPRLRSALRLNLDAQGPPNVTLMSRALGGPAAGTFDATRESVDDLRLARLDGIVLQPGVDAGDVLSGAVDTCWRCRPWIAFLSHATAGRDGPWVAARDMGYRLGHWRVPLYRAANFNRCEVDHHAGQAASLVLAVPEERPADAILEGAAPLD